MLGDAPGEWKPAEKELEKRGLAAAVAAHQTQFPIGIENQIEIFKDRVGAAFRGKCQI